jgi:hypothetical protein
VLSGSLSGLLAKVVKADMPYVDINPHKGRPKWVGNTVLAVLALPTVGVVAISLIPQ